MEKMKKALLIIILLIASFAMTEVCYTEEAADILKTIYLKDGQVIKCSMGWRDGDTFYYRKYGGTIGIPIERVDIDRTYNKFHEEQQQIKEKERQSIVQESDIKYKSKDVLISNFKVVRRSREKKAWKIHLKAGKIPYYEVSFCVTNLAAPSVISIWINTCISKRRVTSTKHYETKPLHTGESEIVRLEYGISSVDRENEIGEWKIIYAKNLAQEKIRIEKSIDCPDKNDEELKKMLSSFVKNQLQSAFKLYSLWVIEVEKTPGACRAYVHIGIKFYRKKISRYHRMERNGYIYLKRDTKTGKLYVSGFAYPEVFMEIVKD